MPLFTKGAKVRETLEDRLLTPSCSAWRLGSGHLWHLSPPSPAEVLGLKRVWEAGLEGGLRCHLVAASEQWRGQAWPASLRALRTPAATTLGGSHKGLSPGPAGLTSISLPFASSSFTSAPLDPLCLPVLYPLFFSFPPSCLSCISPTFLLLLPLLMILSQGLWTNFKKKQIKQI